ncbi:uncharacterized protein beat-IIb [Drosophila takahashii]|uniref:uncharacterized protein beat-IIb n=1 Tax=Drosophila takahashii TaxID=29030 RepID=UPI001CF841B7|nr:uncharacterized protein LOC108056194 [Drosophila takahashii]
MWQTLSTLSTSLKTTAAAATETPATCDCSCKLENAEMQSHMLPSADIATTAMRRCCCRTKITRSNSSSNSSCNYSSNILQWLLLLCLFCDFGQAALRDVNLLVEPPAVRKGQSVALRCDYQLEEAPLYSIKFYRGQMEFYRYTPGEYPHTKVFQFPGIRVDENASNATMVLIRNVSFGLTGTFSCEVTADAPLYSTATAYAQLQVVELPEKRPSLFAEHTRYEPGDILRANCSTMGSRPKADLRFSINNIPVGTENTQYILSVGQLIASRLSLKLQLQAIHFGTGRSGQFANGNDSRRTLTNAAHLISPGRLVLRCTAQIGDLYMESKEIDLGAPQKDPVPARVTLSSGTGLRSFLETYFATSSAHSEWRGAAGGVAVCLVTMLAQLITGS